MGNFISNIYKTKIGRALLIRTAIFSMIYLVFLISFTVFLNVKSNQVFTERQRIDEMKTNLQTMVQALIDQETGQRGFDLTGEKKFLEPYKTGTDSFKKLSGLVKKQTKSYPNLQSSIIDMINLGTYWHNLYGEPQVQARMQGTQISNQWLLDGKNHFDAFRTASVQALDRTALYEQNQALNLQNLVFVYHLLSILLSILLIGLLLFFILRSFERLSQPLVEVQQAVKELSKGNFEYPLPIINKQHDELTELINSLQVMRQKLQWTLNETKQQAETDALTLISNRGSFDQELSKQLNAFQRLGIPFSLIIFDLDHFKRFNDTYGHTEGDRLLQFIARLISRNLSNDDFFARYGGEEFVVLTRSNDPTSLAEKLRRSIEETPLDAYKVTASFGVSLSQNGDTAKTLIDRADRSLYSAKRKGRNQVGSMGSGLLLPT